MFSEDFRQELIILSNFTVTVENKFKELQLDLLPEKNSDEL